MGLRAFLGVQGTFLGFQGTFLGSNLGRGAARACSHAASSDPGRLLTRPARPNTTTPGAPPQIDEMPLNLSDLL